MDSGRRCQINSEPFAAFDYPADECDLRPVDDNRVIGLIFRFEEDFVVPNEDDGFEGAIITDGYRGDGT